MKGCPATEHTIKMVGDDSKAWFGENDLLVNSYHNFGVDKLGKDLDIMALSKDGEIESFSHKREKIMAVMWHPERKFSDEKSREHNKNIITRYLSKLK